MVTAEQHEIDALNARAEQLFAERGDGDASAALAIAAHEAGLELATEDDQTTLYKNAAGEFINCWMKAKGKVFDRIADGGLGFDNNLDGWAEWDEL